MARLVRLPVLFLRARAAQDQHPAVAVNEEAPPLATPKQ